MHPLCRALFGGLIAVCAMNAAAFWISFSPSTATFASGDPVSFSVLIHDVTDLAVYDLSLTYDETLLQYNAPAVDAIPGPQGLFKQPDASTPGELKNIVGSFKFAGFPALDAGPAGVILFSLNFTALEDGTTRLALLGDPQLVGGDGQPIVDVIPEPASLALVGLGLAGLLRVNRRRRSA